MSVYLQQSKSAPKPPELSKMSRHVGPVPKRSEGMRILCLVLQETPQRTEVAQAHFQSIGMEVEFVNGINAEALGIYTANKYMRDDPVNGWPICQKNVGQQISEYIAWTMVACGPDDYAMILEDDALFVPNWKERLDRALVDVPPDWDFIYVGSCNCDYQHVKRHLQGEVWRIEWPDCLHAYLLRKKAAHRLIMQHRQITGPLDLELRFKSLPGLAAYTILPRIADQRNTYIAP